MQSEQRKLNHDMDDSFWFSTANLDPPSTSECRKLIGGMPSDQSSLLSSAMHSQVISALLLALTLVGSRSTKIHGRLKRGGTLSGAAHSNLTGSRQHCRDPITQNTRLPDYTYRLHLHLPFYIYPITFTRLHLHNIFVPDYPITFTRQQPD